VDSINCSLKVTRLITVIVVSIALAGVAFAVAMSGSHALDQSGHAPARILRIVIEPDTRTMFFDHIRTFAKSQNFELSDTSDPHFPTGPIFSFDLDRTDIRMFIIDGTKTVDPYNPNDPRVPPSDPSDYQVFFYNKADTSGRFPGPVDDMVNTFKGAMSDIA
jgi:hypothetical protein